MDAEARAEKRRLKTNASQRAYAQRKKAEVFARLGGCCSHCGFTKPGALQVDHVNGGGLADRKGRGNGAFYHFVLLQLNAGDTGKYQLLCANCNWLKRVERHEHT